MVAAQANAFTCALYLSLGQLDYIVTPTIVILRLRLEKTNSFLTTIYLSIKKIMKNL